MSNKKSKSSGEYNNLPIDDPSRVFTTYDMNCSVALLCAGFKLLTINKGADARKALFVFEKKDGMEEIMDLYWSDRLEVKARRFADTLKSLKNRLYSSE